MCASQLNIALQRKIFPRIAWRVVRYYMYPPLVADATVAPRGTKNLLMKFNEKAISLACPIGEGAERSEAEGGICVAIEYRNPSVCSQSSQPPSLSGKI